MIVHLLTPMTWSAALVPLLDDDGSELIVHETAEWPTIDRRSAVYIAYVDDTNVADVAQWWDSARSGDDLELVLVVVGAGSLRYEWQLRELGAVIAVGHVWEAKRVASIVKRQSKRLPKSEGDWPSWIYSRLPVAS